MGAMSPTHWLIVIAVFVLLFGAKKLPELARSLGQSTRVLKGEMRGLHEDEPGHADDRPAAVRDSGTTARTVPTEV
ncbi:MULTISPECIES: Sec-independent protein translocase subunit TatA [Pseudonocardia]|uniref:Sec-independent protein translocase protein TatA n=2 Tax=Pseudonocardia TaxID=1847 RepID=A0A1Y2MM41_PSEAH|nr:MULTISPECIES: Sec-independent protein translocase subunit TatA [Pseudonocardia]OSY36232.1 Sec-independent protein translocase protein TatA [Pseudonocardia autotrophica]TDN73040.1 sec-independent protein translocase protein TatA [Pseudonocardia autotrophica]BBG03758.1 Sec-independent protein translocase protein TatA [Pseudonocardia autotrophica]GEC26634.1 Sec-independent protein translocase protein TatA [Pseudonocardia saturnea]